LKWVNTSADGFDPTEGTLYMRVYFVATTETAYCFETRYDANNDVYLGVDSSNSVWWQGDWDATAHAVGTTGTVPDATWITIGAAWKVGEAGIDYCATYNGTTWQDLDRDPSEMASDPPYFLIGNDIYPRSDDVYIDKIVILSTFKAALPAWW